jgi:hypothetical protein
VGLVVVAAAASASQPPQRLHEFKGWIRESDLAACEVQQQQGYATDESAEQQQRPGDLRSRGIDSPF